jgi:polyribonucleotide nucleotidyltransferase
VCVEVPTRGHTGFIIGARGVNVKRMEQETGARLRMDDRAQLMIITGKQHAVDRAARMVEEAVDKAEAIERGEGPPPGRR